MAEPTMAAVAGTVEKQAPSVAEEHAPVPTKQWQQTFPLQMRLIQQLRIQR